MHAIGANFLTIGNGGVPPYILNGGMIYHRASWSNAMPCHAVPCRAILCHATPFPAIPSTPIPSVHPFRFPPYPVLAWMQIDSQHGYQTKHMLCLPLVNKTGSVIAVLQLRNKLKGSCFVLKDVQALEQWCRQAALALDNSLLYQQLQCRESILGQIQEALPTLVLGLDDSGFLVSSNRCAFPSRFGPLWLAAAGWGVGAGERTAVSARSMATPLQHASYQVPALSARRKACAASHPTWTWLSEVGLLPGSPNEAPTGPSGLGGLGEKPKAQSPKPPPPPQELTSTTGKAQKRHGNGHWVYCTVTCGLPIPHPDVWTNICQSMPSHLPCIGQAREIQLVSGTPLRFQGSSTADWPSEGFYGEGGFLKMVW